MSIYWDFRDDALGYVAGLTGDFIWSTEQEPSIHLTCIDGPILFS